MDIDTARSLASILRVVGEFITSGVLETRIRALEQRALDNPEGNLHG